MGCLVKRYKVQPGFKSVLIPKCMLLTPKLYHFLTNCVDTLSHCCVCIFFSLLLLYTIESIPNCHSWSSLVGIVNVYACLHIEPSWYHCR